MKALIFDFDGLIIDSESPDFQCWQEIYHQYGCELLFNIWAEFIGRGANDITFDLYTHLEVLSGQTIDRESIRQQRRQRYMEIIAQQALLPGVKAYFDTAQTMGIKLAIASSGSLEWIEPQLARLNIRHYFDAIRCADHVQRTKPDPEVYRTALAALDISAQQAIAFEDSRNGSLAATEAGLFTVVVPNPMTKQQNFDHAHLRLRSLAAMPLVDLLAHPSLNPA